MKKIVLMAAVLMAGYTATAQGFYGEVNIGYGFGFPGSGLGTSSHTEILNAATVSSETKNLKGGFGAGINLTLTPGYQFNDHIAVELGINYFMGNNVLVQEGTSNLNIPAMGVTNQAYDNGTGHAKSSQFRLIPAMVVSTGFSDKISGYVRAGIVLPIAGATIATSERVEYDMTPTATGAQFSTTTTEVEQKIKGAFTVGFRGAAGVNFMVSDKISVFAEAFITSLHVKRATAEITNYSVNGVDGLGFMTTAQKQTEYVDEILIDNNTVIDANSPSKSLATKTNFNQLGLAIGAKFNF